MDTTEGQLIDALFARIQQAAMQSDERDAAAEARIAEHMQRIPGAAYFMAQTIVIQHQTLKQAEIRIAELEQQQANSHQPTQSQSRPTLQQNPQPRSGGGGFLAGAAETALGVAGGMLLARGVSDLIDGITGSDRFFEDAIAADLIESEIETAYVVGYEDAADEIDAAVEDSLDDADLWGDGNDWGW